MAQSQEKGVLYEEVAARTLEKKGYTILERRYRSRFGEIDLIVRDTDGTLCFEEVKYRSHSDYGTGLEAVDRKKQQKIKKTAMFYLAEHHAFEEKIRFDVISLWPENGKIKGRHIQNAFEYE